MPPRASTPVGIALLDKPPGPSSFALVADLRRRTRARTGHTGTLDPFASGLLILLSGSATRLAPCFVGLDKHYVTIVDLTSTTSTGDPEGDELERHEAPSRDALEARLEGLRGEVELPIPAASAVKIGGERAYRLARRGVEVDMPVRRSPVYALDVITYMGDQVELGLHVGSGTYVRSIAAALGGHCIALRRTAVGPFRVEESDPERLLPVAEALRRLPAEALERVPYGLRAQVLAFEREVSGGEVLPSLPDVENAEWEPVDQGPGGGGAA
jgi:tRNA pseudouridine55 synthase